ncbi:LysM peptidoglycan-binding domain-containing protein [Kribbella sp. NPDC056345]|uniref:LysM peptidoglycan-binding domain-containing protein n=1 Tax=Kribbella sp. NPDC056345 TaxID=3345789 RepID=UPI0035D5E132
MSTAELAAAALPGDVLPGRLAPEVAPAPQGVPRRRRIPGSTTEPLPVRGCAGEVLGRHVADPAALRQVARRQQARQARELEAPSLRLTRRGRMLVSFVSVLVFGSAIAVLGLRIAGVLDPGPDFSSTVPVQVAPGQSLWSIAQETNPEQDPALVIEKIAELNQLSGPADLTPGQTLQIPIAR